MHGGKVAGTIPAIPNSAVRRNVADLEHTLIVFARIMLQAYLVFCANLECIALHSFLQRPGEPLLHHVQSDRIDSGIVEIQIGKLIVIETTKSERIGNIRQSPDVIGMSVGEHEVVDLALRNEPFDVAANPLACTAA